MFLPINNFSIDRLESKLFNDKGVSVSVARLDKIHSEISGNKLFKLHYFIEECLRSEHKTMLTFGGAYSNHLAATAAVCREKKINCIGLVRGEGGSNLSHTLSGCRENGMQLHFISRDEYKNITADTDEDYIQQLYGKCTVVPEGGYSPQGAKGASLIMDLQKDLCFTHICTATGTATTLAGLLLKKKPVQKIISVPVIRNMTDIQERLNYLTPGIEINADDIFTEYHFGGYAKYTNELITFMNKFYTEHGIPTDFVYTGKLMHAITDKINKGHFEKGSNILLLHTGGLQGNRSLEKGKLIFNRFNMPDLF